MPRGDKSKYTDKQERKAEHIEKGYEKHGVGKKPGGSGRGKITGHPAARKGGKAGGKASAARPAAARKASAKKAAATWKRRGN